MKPILFSKDETNFTTNGLGRLDCVSCRVIEERNGMYELEAEVPINGAHVSEVQQLSIIGVIPHDGGNVQAFVVYKITKPINGRFMVYARHLSYRLSDIPCSPFSVALSPQACANTLAGLKSNAIETCPFTFHTDVTTAAAYTQKIPASIRQRLGGIEGSVLDQFGGEYEWDNWDVYLHKQRGRLASATGISLRYGKNITDINQEEEIAGTVTGIVPFWIDTDGNNLVMLSGSPNDPVVYSQYASNYPYHLTQTLDLSSEYEDKPTVAQLRSVANAYVNKSDFGIPKVSIKVSFVNLWETEEYKDIAPLERVQLCDEITVDFEKLGIKALAKVVKTDYDVLKERYNSIEVGSIRTTLAQAVTDRDKDIDTAFVQQLIRVNTAIADATAWLTSANGYVVAVKNQDGSWKELLFMDTNDPQTARNILRINNNGLGFSTTGINGPYTNAWTIDGNLVADFIKVGILGDKANKNFWNMVTGEFSLQAGATVGGKTVDAIAQEKANAAQAAAESVAAAALSAAVNDLQGQIDGNITSWFYNYAPTTSNAPASTWTTVDDKINHIGDLFYDSITGYCYRWQIKSTVVDPTHPTANDFEWVRISDEDISEALSKAQTAQDTADGKRRVFISQPVPPYDIGDLWTTGASGDILTCTTAKTESGVYDASDWEKLNKYTDDTAVANLNTALTQQEIFNRLTNNGQTQGIYLSGGKIYINASYIQTGTLSADLITTGSMSANRITSGILQSSNVNAYGAYPYTASGSYYDLINGDIRTPFFAALSSSGSTAYAYHLKFQENNVSLPLGAEFGIDFDDYYSQLVLEYNSNTHFYPGELRLQDGNRDAYVLIESGSRQYNAPSIKLKGRLGEYYYVRMTNNSIGILEGSSNWQMWLYNDSIYKSRQGVSQNVLWDSGSDRRIKEDIQALSIELSVSFIDKTEAKRFKYIGLDGVHYGMIAQDAREILDELGENEAQLEHKRDIRDSASEIKNQRTIDYNEYIPHLINYVKDLRETVNRQQAEIDELKEIVKRISV